MPADLHGEPASEGRVQAAEAAEQPQKVPRAAERGGVPALHFHIFPLYVFLIFQVEHLHWQLNKMENSRKLYELATGQLVTFLEQVFHHPARTWSPYSVMMLGFSPDLPVERSLPWDRE